MPSNPAAAAAPGERGLREQLGSSLVQRRLRSGPVGDRQVERPVDVERPDPERAQIGDIGDDRRDRAARVRLEVRRHLDPVGARGSQDRRQALILG